MHTYSKQYANDEEEDPERARQPPATSIVVLTVMGSLTAQARLTLPRREMPRSKCGSWQPKGAQQDPRWLEGAAERLDRVRTGLGASAAAAECPEVVETAWPLPGAEPAAASSSGDGWASRRLTGVQPRGQPEKPAQELAALRLGRTTPTAFNIQRHAVMVCGRPVVVPSPCICVVFY